MTTFSDVLDLAQAANVALTSMEEAAKSRTLSNFAALENGTLSYGELRTEVLRQAKNSYLVAGSVAHEHVRAVSETSGLPRFDTPLMSTSPTLDKILDDMVSNLEAYRDSVRGETELRRLRFRTWLSVQAAIQFGFTENQLHSGHALADKGATLKKVWLCNFTDNTPCETCLWLHGREIDLDAEFPHGHQEREPKVYLGTLLGPPRHPNCHCYMLVYVVTLEHNQVIPPAPNIADEKFMSSKDVRKLPRAIYAAAIATYRIIAGKLKGAIRGKR